MPWASEPCLKSVFVDTWHTVVLLQGCSRGLRAGGDQALGFGKGMCTSNTGPRCRWPRGTCGGGGRPHSREQKTHPPGSGPGELPSVQKRVKMEVTRLGQTETRCGVYFGFFLHFSNSVQRCAEVRKGTVDQKIELLLYRVCKLRVVTSLLLFESTKKCGVYVLCRVPLGMVYGCFALQPICCCSAVCNWHGGWKKMLVSFFIRSSNWHKCIKY